jgi:hypothetical protein
VQSYVEIGRGIGAGLGEAARSMGVAVNEFAATPVGKMTMLVILWKFVGSDAVGIVFGLLWFAVMIPLWVHFFRRICLQGKIRETFDPESGKRLTREVEALDLRSDSTGGYRFAALCVLFLISVAGFTMIFG